MAWGRFQVEIIDWLDVWQRTSSVYLCGGARAIPQQSHRVGQLRKCNTESLAPPLCTCDPFVGILLSTWYGRIFPTTLTHSGLP